MMQLIIRQVLVKHQEVIAEVKERLARVLPLVRRRSVIVSPSIHNIDVLGLLRDDDAAWVSYMHMRGGAVVQSITLEYRLSTREETDAEIMSMAISEVHQRFADTYRRDKVTEVVVNVMPDVEFEGITFSL